MRPELTRSLFRTGHVSRRKSVSDCPQICPHLLERLSDVVSEGGFARMGVFKSPSNVVATQRPRRRPCLNDVPGYCEKP